MQPLVDDLRTPSPPVPSNCNLRTLPTAGFIRHCQSEITLTADLTGLETESNILDNLSNMKDVTPTLNDRIADRIRDLRGTRRYSLEALANQSGVSRSMLSLIERGEASPTAVVLEKIAAGLNVTLSSLFETPTAAASDAPQPLARREDQPVWQDPASGYQRRNVSPPGTGQPMHLVEVHFPPGARVAFDNTARHSRVCQQVWLLDGEIDITVGDIRHALRAGDCLAMDLDQPTMFHNPATTTARYAVVILCEPPETSR